MPYSDLPVGWSDMTPEEVTRMVLAHEKILSTDNGRFIRRDVYSLDQKHLLEDVGEIKDTLKWGLRMVVAQFLGLIVTLVVMLVALAQ